MNFKQAKVSNVALSINPLNTQAVNLLHTSFGEVIICHTINYLELEYT